MPGANLYGADMQNETTCLTPTLAGRMPRIPTVPFAKSVDSSVTIPIAPYSATIKSFQFARISVLVGTCVDAERIPVQRQLTVHEVSQKSRARV